MLSSLVLASLASGAFTVMAAEGDETAIERMTVTTQKRVQSIQDVPVTVTAFSGEMLEHLGIADLDVLSDITPGLVIQEQSPNNPGFVIRGITSDSGSAQASPRVSVYYNGTDISRSRGSYFELFDIERVEVVKGPQATLFGTAASVGALSVTTRKPQEEFEAGKIRKISALEFQLILVSQTVFPYLMSKQLNGIGPAVDGSLPWNLSEFMKTTYKANFLEMVTGFMLKTQI